jgi:hypothetical protein
VKSPLCATVSALVSALLFSCSEGISTRVGPAATEPDLAERHVVLQFSPDLAPVLCDRVTRYVARVCRHGVSVREAGEDLSALGPGFLVLAFGNTATTRRLIPETERASLDYEGFIVRSGTSGGTRILVADGQPGPPSMDCGNRGLAFGTYALLEELGFSFLHPLEPILPSGLVDPGAVNRVEVPRWPIRGIHLHTMHPTELTLLLQGWGPDGPEDEPGWRALLPEWDDYLEWLLANRQNRVEWVILWASSWKDFADSALRQERLRLLVERAEAFGLLAGANVPIALVQQHAFHLVRSSGSLEEEVAQIRTWLDWIMAAGFHFLKTDLGTTEFNSVGDLRMLAWVDEVARYLDEVYRREAFIDLHCSTGQVAEHFSDPRTGEPLNYNFLPCFADPRMGVMPHTVQHYALDDPAPTYGNTDFGYMHDILRWVAGSRSTVWFPETAYWVSFDVDVPLFLPVYAGNRLYDLRLLAADEAAGRMGSGPHVGSRMDGQMVFSSGWEWGYWMNDVVAARAAWDPFLGEPDDERALRRALAPVVSPFGSVAGEVEDLLVETVQAERELLIEGRVGGIPPEDIVGRNGQAYLQGYETWDDFSFLAVPLPGFELTPTQPKRVAFSQLAEIDYPGHLEPLLAEMETTFFGLALRFEALAPEIPAHARSLYDDLRAALKITALRASQVHGLYDYVHARRQPEGGALAAACLQKARDALDEAQLIVDQREASYRVAPDLVAGWRRNPTAYDFGYLWTVRTLYYWWRDEGRAVLGVRTPCYLNIIDMLDVGFGDEDLIALGRCLYALGKRFPPLAELTECLADPEVEPEMPPPGIR